MIGSGDAPDHEEPVLDGIPERNLASLRDHRDGAPEARR